MADQVLQKFENENKCSVIKTKWLNKKSIAFCIVETKIKVECGVLSFLLNQIM